MKRRLPRRKAGFALVATLTMLMLLTVLAVGTMSLSTISLRQSDVDRPRREAEANARVALMVALGQLQKQMGPDQRVAGDARLLTRSGTSANPHWLSAWKTTKKDGAPWIIRSADAGGLADLRQSDGFDPEADRLGILVSGNEAGIRFPDSVSLGNGDSALLVGTGSLGSEAGTEEQVRAPLVTLPAGSGGQGAYAWWVGDLGTRANVATRDTSAGTQAGQYHSQLLAQDSSWQAFGKSEIPDDRRPAMVDESQLGLYEDNSKNRHFHDFTVWSAGLPVDAREGGWRRDLSAFLESAGSIADLKADGVDLPGLKDSDLMVGPANAAADALSANPGQAKRLSLIAPKFGLLRKWAARSGTARFGNFTSDTETGDLVSKSTGGANTKSVDIQNRTKSHLMPVLTEGSFYYNVSYYEPAKPAVGFPYALRVHYYPRVVLWNPFNFPIKVPESSIFMHINGSKSIEITLTGGQKQTFRMYWGRGGSATGGSVRGSMFFKMAAATIQPGESLVWSPAANAPYNESNFAKNLLSPDVAPSTGRALYQDTRADGFPLFGVQQTRPPTAGLANNAVAKEPIDWREIVPPKPSGDIQAAAYTQADDYFMSWKPLSATTFTDAAFSNFPMGRFVSCAYQYGDEDEMPVEWTSLDPVPFPKSTAANPTVNQLPDRRTRDGFRLRWFDETESNRIGSGSLAGTPHLEDSAIGNWNLRASWSFRNPFENVTDVAPNFFGIFTRDLFDGEVDWSSMNPRASGGKFHGDPFDQPSRGPEKRILFDVPREGAEIASLGAFQHVNFSEFIWHPTYALGNSLADPRVPVNHTEPDRAESINKDKGGWNQDSIGYSTDGRSGNDNGATNDADNWAWTARNFFQQTALDQSLVYDLSYELNHSLWDSYFLSSGTAAQKRALLEDNVKGRLPNGRMTPNPMAGKIKAEELTDYHRAASKLLIEGAFNVNSTSIGAWESLLLSGAGGTYGDRVAFPRFLSTPGGPWEGTDPHDDKAWSGQRTFSREEIRRLAEAIVNEVKLRGPFISMADFVNRRLGDGDPGKKGALQAAIDTAGLNNVFKDAWPLDNSKPLSNFNHIDHIADPTRMEQTLKPDTTAWGGLGFLTQADLLQFIGPALSVRSDTFTIRAYGESRDKFGKVVAKAWCEAVVQRSPNYVDPADSPLALPASLSTRNKELGRKFEVVFFRWLHPGEV